MASSSTGVLWTDEPESSSTLAPLVGRWVPQGASTSTLMWERSGNSWWPEVAQRIVSEVRRCPVSHSTLVSTIAWLTDLPGGIPRPHVGAGDDGTISIEWDRGENHLHVMFEDNSGEVFFHASNGDEWDTPIDAGHDKIRAALRAIARA
jgi:hypothetical protein